MPLVTRQANQGTLWRQSAEPADWLNAELWADTDTDLLYINQAGTAAIVGKAAAEGKLEALGTHRATTSESTHSFTGSWDLDADYSALFWTWSGTQTAALVLGLRINGVSGTDYRELRINQSSTTITGVATTGATYHTIIPTGGAGGYYMRASGFIQYMGSADAFLTQSIGNRFPSEQSVNCGDVAPASSAGVIDDVTILTSTSTWTANTQFDLYGILT